MEDATFPIFGAASFVLEDKGYVVAGWVTLEEDTNGDGKINQGVTNRLFRFDPEKGELDSLGLPLGEWIQLDRIPNGLGLLNPVAFAVNNKGYVATGVAFNGSTDEVYEFTPTVDGGNWLKKKNFPGSIRQKAVSFVIDDKAYLATGSNAGFQGALSTFKDLWEYDSIDDSWTQRTDIDKFNIDSSTAFSVRGKAYIYGGFIAKEFSTISHKMRIYTPEKETYKRAIKD